MLTSKSGLSNSSLATQSTSKACVKVSERSTQTNTGFFLLTSHTHFHLLVFHYNPKICLENLCFWTNQVYPRYTHHDFHSRICSKTHNFVFQESLQFPDISKSPWGTRWLLALIMNDSDCLNTRTLLVVVKCLLCVQK